MDTLVKADIFFFITALSVVFISTTFTVVLIYLIKILRDVTVISHKARDEGEKIIEDIDSARQTLKKEGRKTAINYALLRGRFKKEAEKFLAFLAFLAGFLRIKKRSPIK